MASRSVTPQYSDPQDFNPVSFQETDFRVYNFKNLSL